MTLYKLAPTLLSNPGLRGYVHPPSVGDEYGMTQIVGALFPLRDFEPSNENTGKVRVVLHHMFNIFIILDIIYIVYMYHVYCLLWFKQYRTLCIHTSGVSFSLVLLETSHSVYTNV